MNAPSKKTILIAHIDGDFAQDLTDKLAREGLDSVMVVEDGNEAIAIAELKHPDLIVLGMRLPSRSGFLVIERLRQTDVTCPIIMATEIEGRRHQHYAIILGVDGYHVGKNVTRNVVASVCELLEHSFAGSTHCAGEIQDMKRLKI